MDTNVIVLVGASVAAIGVFVVWSRSAGDSSANVDSLMSEGMLFRQRQDYVQAELKLEKALAELQSSRKPDLTKSVACMVALAGVYESNAKPEKSKQLLREFCRAGVRSWRTTS
jgi:hypothetical protein